MNFTRILIIHLILLTGISSCTISDHIGSFQVEILKPGIFNIPKDVKTVAIFNRGLLQPEASKVVYFKLGNIIEDSTIHYRDLSNNCTDALAGYLKNESYFSKVVNYHDSLNQSFNDLHYPETITKLLQQSGTDACIFLDYFRFNSSMVYDYGNRFYTFADAKWSVAFKNDTSTYLYNQLDTLIFEDRESIESQFKIKPVVTRFNEASENVGELFGTKLIPFNLVVDRLYYKSHNSEMMKAQKLALNNEWRAAADIWRKMTYSKNRNMATKAMFNMALACEMEGKPELAITWAVKSYSGLRKDDKYHKANCQRYVNVLALRKLELARLEKQIR
jgi:hypothetical protein